MPVVSDIDALVVMLPAGARVLVSGGPTESLVLADALDRAGKALGPMVTTGIFVPGLNRRIYLPNFECRVETFFLTPELKAQGASVTFLPLCYNDIRRHLMVNRVDAALFMVSPPDENGMCSFGPSVDFLAELWPTIPIRLAHINPLMPKTRGLSHIPLSEITAYVETPQTLLEMPDLSGDPVSDAIAKAIAGLVPDGTTLQIGLGKIPGAVLRSLTGRRDLRIHSGLIGDAVMDLEAAGALAPGIAVTTGVAIGSARLYRAVEGPAYQFVPVSHTHNEAVIGGIKEFISINSAIEVDLFGQAYAEAGPKGLMSGPGGATDFARGARLAGGLRIVALAATAGRGAISRIIGPNSGTGPVSLSRTDVDIVVTEFGVARLSGRTHADRAKALISVAAPGHRGQLADAWETYCSRL